MNHQTAEQLDKILALADSGHEAEALGAVRMARRVLSRDGLSFGDLARVAAQRSRFSLSRSLFSSANVGLEMQLTRLQQQLSALENLRDDQAAELEAWRRRAYELEQQLAQSQAESRRWKDIARESLEKLWDVGSAAHPGEFRSEDAAEEPKRAVG